MSGVYRQSSSCLLHPQNNNNTYIRYCESTYFKVIDQAEKIVNRILRIENITFCSFSLELLKFNYEEIFVSYLIYF